MTNEQMTATEKEDDKLSIILSREKEIQSYQVNIDNYTETLKQLPQDDWPVEISQYKNLKSSEEIAVNVPADKLQQVSDYALRDRVKFLKTTEILEQNKTKMLYDGAIASTKTVSGDTDTQLNTKLAAKKTELDAK